MKTRHLCAILGVAIAAGADTFFDFVFAVTV